MVEDFFVDTFVHKRLKIDEDATDPDEGATEVTLGTYKGYIQYKSSSINYPARTKTVFADYVLICQRDLGMIIDDIIVHDSKRYKVVIINLMTLTSQTFSTEFDKYGLLYVGNEQGA